MSLPSSSSSPLLVLSLLLLSSLPSSTLADGGKPIVTPITKDPLTGLYTIPIKSNGAALVLDLAGNLVWSSCNNQQGLRTVPCKSSVCKVANRNREPCGPPVGVGNPDPRCTCIAYAVNLISGRCGNGQLAVLPFSANATNGDRPLFPVSFNAYQTCAPNEFVLESLPSGAVGMAGLSRQLLSLPNQVASKLKVAKQFALCLPSGSSSQPGAAIFGGGPFVLQSQKPEDLTQSLVGSLPLVKNPKNSAYYFRVHGIAVNQKAVALPAGVLDLDPHTGRGGVVFSTLTQYTTLRDDIYGKVLEAFEKATSGVEWVKPPPPFFRCFPESAFSPTRLGPGVANIDLMLENGRNWTLPGASSLVPVAGRLCFAFQSMGSPASQAPDAPAIIFGTHQMQDNLVQFDLEKNTFGFSGLLLGRSTNCGNFNFKSS